MSSPELLLVRVDAGPAVGIGHAMRCLALAQGWKDTGGEVLFAMAETLPALRKRLDREGIEIEMLREKPGGPEDATRTGALARDRDAAWLVADGYRFDGRFLRTAKQSGVRLLVLDDYGHADSPAADIVLNQNLSARADLYAMRSPTTRLLLGPAYVLLQRNFRSRRPRPRETPPVARHVLVTLGGVDPHNVTLKALEALKAAAMPSVVVRVVVGSGNAHGPSLESAARTFPGGVELVRDPPDMAALMEDSDLAISAGGTTAWELAYLGVPSLLFATADNQREVAASLERAGAAKDLGWHEDVTVPDLARTIPEVAESRSLRERMASQGRALVDGQGVPRVRTELKAALITMRPVEEGDARLLWGWANDRTVRSASFNEEPIPWEDHITWFDRKRRDPQCLFYVALDRGGTPLGQIRFDVQGEGAEVSVSLDARFRNQGYGGAVILAGSRKVFATSKVQRLHAYIKERNESSTRAFETAGYASVGRATVRGHEALHLVQGRGKSSR